MQCRNFPVARDYMFRNGIVLHRTSTALQATWHTKSLPGQDIGRRVSDLHSRFMGEDEMRCDNPLCK